MYHDPQNAILLLNRALAFLKMEEWKRAANDCTLAIKLDQSNLKGFWRRAIAWKNMKNYNLAEKDFKHILSLDDCNEEMKSEIEKKLNSIAEIMSSRPQDFKETALITADQLASAITSAQTALEMSTPPSPEMVGMPGFTITFGNFGMPTRITLNNLPQAGVGNDFQATPPSMNQSANTGSNPSPGPANYEGTGN